MKKILIFACLFVSSGIQLNAQIKIEKSEAFEEPLSEGWTKLLLLKNGNTFYFHYGGNRGLEVIVFDKNKKKTHSQRITGKNWNSGRKNRVKVCGLYEINKEPVLFLQYLDGRAPVLCRLRINADNGSLTKEEVVGEGSKKRLVLTGNAYVTGEDINVTKDPNSDNYAVIYINGTERDPNDRISVVHFDGTHKEINTSFYNSPQSDFRKLTLIGAVVDGAKRVFIVTYGARNNRGKEGHVYIARLNAADSVVTNKTLDFTEDFMNTSSDIRYDHGSNRLVMLTNTVTSRRSVTTNIISFLSYIDPEDLSLKGVNAIGSEKVNAYAHKNIGPKADFKGVPQKLVLNSDNSVTVLQEEQTIQTITSQKTNQVVAVNTYLGNIGITEINSDGTEKSGCALLKKQLYIGQLGPMYMAGRDRGVWLNDMYSRRNVDDNLLMSYEYIHTAGGSYVLYNDNPKNDKKKESQKKRKLTMNTDFLNTICYSIQGDVAKKSYLFGEPVGKNNTRACYIEASHFDQSTNTYTTVVSEQHGRKYDSRIAWIHFD